MERWENRIETVRRVAEKYPHLLQKVRDSKDERDRADFVDQVAHELNREDGLIGGIYRWGRKARIENDPTSLNDDVVTYLRDSGDWGNKKLIDVLSGLPELNLLWDVRPESEEPGNGFWYPPVNPDLEGTLPPVEPPIPTPPLDDIAAQLAALREDIVNLRETVGEVLMIMAECVGVVELVEKRTAISGKIRLLGMNGTIEATLSE